MSRRSMAACRRWCSHRQAELIEQCLRKESIPYVVAGREDFLAEEPVRGVLAFFRFLIRPEDSVSLRTLLRAAGVPAQLDVYHCDMHAFDMMRPQDARSVEAAETFNRQFAYARAHYFTPQREADDGEGRVR